MTSIVKIELESFDENLILDLKQAAENILNESNIDLSSIENQGYWGRLVDKLKLSDESGNRVALQIRSLTQAQTCVIKLLNVLSEVDKSAFDILKNHSTRVEELSEGICDISDVVIDLKERLEDLEIKWIENDIKSFADYRDLPPDELKILSSILNALSDKFEDTSEGQKRYYNYINAICNGFYQSKGGSVVDLFDKIESKRFLKIIITSCLIYISLRSEDASVDEADKFIDDLGHFSSKQLIEIKNEIERIKNKAGESAFTSKNINSNNKSKSIIEFKLELDEENISSDENLVSHDDSFFEDELVDGNFVIQKQIIKEGEVVSYFNKNIFIEDKIICNGTISFTNCKISYGSKYDGIIYLSGTSEIRFTRSKVVQTEWYEGTDDVWLFDKDSSSEGQSILVENCIFINCSSLIRVSKSTNFKIIGSLFLNPGHIFDNGDGKIDVSRSYFSINPGAKWAQGECSSDKLNFSLTSSEYSFSQCSFYGENNISHFQLSPYSDITFQSCFFYGIVFGAEDDYFHRIKINSLNCVALISQCEFHQCKLQFDIRNKSIINGNNFIDCWDMFRGSCGEFFDNEFINCARIAVFAENFTFNLCRFINSKSVVIDDHGLIDERSFSVFQFLQNPNNFNKCDFLGYESKDSPMISFLFFAITPGFIRSDVNHNYGVTYINECCIFKNIKTANKIIQDSILIEEESWFGLSKEVKNISTVSISNDSTGYNKKWDVGYIDDYTIRERSSCNNNIGVTDFFSQKILTMYLVPHIEPKNAVLAVYAERHAVKRAWQAAACHAALEGKTLLLETKQVFLSDKWFLMVGHLTSAAENLNIPPNIASLIVNLSVTGAREGVVKMCLNGGLIEQGHNSNGHITMTLPPDLVRRIFVELDQSAMVQGFMSGQIKFEGGMSKLIAMQSARQSDAQTELYKKIMALTLYQ